MQKLLIVIPFLLLLSNLAAQNAYHYDQPQTLNDGLPTSTLESHNIDTTKLFSLLTQLHSNPHKIHSMLVLSKGELILEEYFNGYHTDKLHDLRSVTKSFRSLLMGIAIEKGFIENVEDPITKYMTEYVSNPKLQKIKIKHLLTMSTGLECNDWDKKSKGQEDKVYKKKDWLKYFLDLPMINEPGTVSNYCSLGAILVAEIITRASGMPINTFAQQYLFDPLQITKVQWGHTSKKPVITSAKRLYMTPRDMTKIGLLVLNHGQWNNEQIISKSWIETSTAPKAKITNLDYAYLWWKIPFMVGNQFIHATVSTGNGGQYIMVFPTLELVVVFTGGAYNLPEDKVPFEIVRRVLLTE